SVLPAPSIARTWNVCAPSATVNVTGVGHATNAEPSSEHSKREPSSVAANATVAAVDAVAETGADVIVVSGGVVSTGDAGAVTVSACVAVCFSGAVAVSDGAPV